MLRYRGELVPDCGEFLRDGGEFLRCCLELLAYGGELTPYDWPFALARTQLRRESTPTRSRREQLPLTHHAFGRDRAVFRAAVRTRPQERRTSTGSAPGISLLPDESDTASRELGRQVRTAGSLLPYIPNCQIDRSRQWAVFRVSLANSRHAANSARSEGVVGEVVVAFVVRSASTPDMNTVSVPRSSHPYFTESVLHWLHLSG